MNLHKLCDLLRFLGATCVIVIQQLNIQSNLIKRCVNHVIFTPFVIHCDSASAITEKTFQGYALFFTNKSQVQDFL